MASGQNEILSKAEEIADSVSRGNGGGGRGKVVDCESSDLGPPVTGDPQLEACPAPHRPLLPRLHLLRGRHQDVGPVERTEVNTLLNIGFHRELVGMYTVPFLEEYFLSVSLTVCM